MSWFAGVGVCKHSVVCSALCSCAFLLSAPLCAQSADFDPDTCSFNGIELKGKVKVVESFPDIKVKVVDSFPDLRVKLKSSFARDCGEWQMVDSFPDFKVKFVNSFPDLEIKMVDSFPGVP